MILHRPFAPATWRRDFRIEEPRLDIGAQGHIPGIPLQPGALLECEAEGERGRAFCHASPILRYLAPPPDSREAIARGALVLPFIGVLGLIPTKARMLENVIPLCQQFGKMVRTRAQQVRQLFAENCIMTIF